jgi:hypothetical protein
VPVRPFRVLEKSRHLCKHCESGPNSAELW